MLEMLHSIKTHNNHLEKQKLQYEILNLEHMIYDLYDKLESYNLTPEKRRMHFKRLAAMNRQRTKLVEVQKSGLIDTYLQNLPKKKEVKPVVQTRMTPEKMVRQKFVLQTNKAPPPRQDIKRALLMNNKVND